jgi:hypothetical protein
MNATSFVIFSYYLWETKVMSGGLIKAMLPCTNILLRRRKSYECSVLSVFCLLFGVRDENLSLLYLHLLLTG